MNEVIAKLSEIDKENTKLMERLELEKQALKAKNEQSMRAVDERLSLQEAKELEEYRLKLDDELQDYSSRLSMDVSDRLEKLDCYIIGDRDNLVSALVNQIIGQAL